MPDISLSSGKTLCKSLRKYKRHGMLMTCKLPEATRLQVLDALQSLPNQLIQKGDVIPLIMDTGASRTVTGMKDDFLPGTLHDLATPLVLGGVEGKLVAEQAGTVRYEMLDDAGELVVVECEAIYSPTLCCRLFSPQTFHREFYARGAGESEFATRHNRALFRIPKVDGKGTHTITVPYDKSTHLPIIEGFKNATAVAESLAMSCVTDALNQNLTSLQKVMLQWHYKIGHIGFQHLQWIGRQGWLGKMGARIWAAPPSFLSNVRHVSTANSIKSQQLVQLLPSTTKASSRRTSLTLAILYLVINMSPTFLDVFSMLEELPYRHKRSVAALCLPMQLQDSSPCTIKSLSLQWKPSHPS